MAATRKTFALAMVCVLAGCGGGVKSASGDWKDSLADIAGSITLGSEKGFLFYAYDSLAHPGKPVDLTARLQEVKGFGGIEGATIGFYRDKKLVGSAKTDNDGFAKVAWTPPADTERTYEFAVRVTNGGQEEKAKELSDAPLIIGAYKEKKSLVIIDLDHTVVASSFFRVLIGGAKPMADSQDVAKRLAGKYGVVYLTHRPNIMTRNSKKWLQSNDYPLGPLLVSKLKETVGDSGKYKTGRIKALHKTYPKDHIGIGDKLSDAQAYIDNGMTAYLIPHYKEKPNDMRKMARDIRKLKAAGRLQIVNGWRQIEQGIFEGKKFPPEAFAKALEARADKLEKEKEDKDNDDD